MEPGYSERPVTYLPLQCPDNLVFLALVSLPCFILQVFRYLLEGLFHIIALDNFRDKVMKSFTSHCFLLIPGAL